MAARRRERSEAPTSNAPAAPPAPSTNGRTNGAVTGPSGEAWLPASERVTEQLLNDWFVRQWRRWQAVRDKDEAVRLRASRQRAPTHVGRQGEGGELLAELVRSGTLRTLEREFVGILSSVPPRFEALAKGIGPVHQRRATHIEDWVDAWHKAVKGDRVVRLVDTNVCRYGRGVYFVAWAQQFWHGMPTREADESAKAYTARVEAFKAGAPPAVVAVSRPAPQCLHEEDDLSPFLGPARAAFWEMRPLSELAARYPQSGLAREHARDHLRQDFSDPPRLHVCFANRRELVYATAAGVALDSETGDGSVPPSLTRSTLHGWEIVDVYEHRLGRCPFEVQEGGPSDDPELVYRYEGLFDNALGLVDAFDDALTQMATGTRRYARAVPLIEWEYGPSGSLPAGIDPAKIAAQPVEWNPDRPRVGLPGQKHTFWQPDLRGLAAILQYLDRLDGLIQRDTLSPTNYGRTPRSGSGFHEVVNLESAQRKLGILLDAKREALHGVTDLAMRWVARIGGSTTTGAGGVVVRAAITEEGEGGPLSRQIVREDLLKLTADEARSASIAVHVDTRLDAADAASAQIGLQISQVLAQGGIDVDPAWILSRWFHLSDPERHHLAAELWRHLHSPEIVSWVRRRALEEADLLMEADEAKLVADLARLSPPELMLIPKALQQVLAEKGVVPPGMLPPGMGAGAAPQLPPGLPGLGGPGLPPGPLGATPQLAATLGPAAPPGPPNPLTAASAAGAPRLPGLGLPVAGASPSSTGNLMRGVAQRMRAGLPRTPPEAGV